MIDVINNYEFNSTKKNYSFILGGHTTLLGLINSFIHVIMYTYYMLAAMGPYMQKYLWWKKYLTVMQMVRRFYIVKFLSSMICHT